MVAENDVDRKIFADQARIMRKVSNMSKAGIEPDGYAMRTLFEETKYK